MAAQTSTRRKKLAPIPFPLAWRRPRSRQCTDRPGCQVFIASRASRASAPPHIEPLVLRALGPDSDRVEVEGDVLT